MEKTAGCNLLHQRFMDAGEGDRGYSKHAFPSVCMEEMEKCYIIVK